MEIKKIAVMGAGQMGAGIAQVAAQAGYHVVVRDIKQEFVDHGLKSIRGNLERAQSKGKITAPDAEATLGRIRGAVELSTAALDSDLVIEAVVENATLKRELFAELDKLLRPHAILASNTSSIPISDLAAATRRPDKFIGMHFMNPVPVMKLVEVIRGADTSDDTARSIVEVATKMGKTPVEVHDFPGFISNRVLLPMINEAIFAYQEGVATPEAIDTIMRLGMNHPMGPLELADFIGLDTCLYIMDVLHDGFKDSKYRAAPLLRKKVLAGHLGKKTGKGFYKYNEKGEKVGTA
jgi:3-hydroxybutyryl-CoA dehydrogenase